MGQDKNRKITRDRIPGSNSKASNQAAQVTINTLRKTVRTLKSQIRTARELNERLKSGRS